MQNEKISFVINCFSKNNSLDPSALVPEILLNLNIIKDINDLSESRPGSLATYFKTRNGKTIKVTKNELFISSTAYATTFNIFNSLREFYPTAFLYKIEFI
jgi:hypothetical protein